MRQTSYSAKEFLAANLGVIYQDKEKLHQMLGLPKTALDYIDKLCEMNNDYEFYDLIISSCKKIFTSNPQYLMNMQEEDVKELISMVYENIENNHLFDTLMMLVDYVGASSYKTIFNYIADRHTYKYGLYIDAAYRLYKTGRITAIDWKRNELSISEKIDELLDIVEKLADTETYIYDKEFFEKEKEIWKKYEYTNREYMVTYPKKPEDLYNEGEALNHCAGKYIPSVVRGETIILFLRKCGEPDKPYFTIEIKNGMLRQCHGFNNIGYEDGFDGMEEFIVNFCKEKKLIFNIGNGVFGPD